MSKLFKFASDSLSSFPAIDSSPHHYQMANETEFSSTLRVAFGKEEKTGTKILMKQQPSRNASSSHEAERRKKKLKPVES